MPYADGPGFVDVSCRRPSTDRYACVTMMTCRSACASSTCVAQFSAASRGNSSSDSARNLSEPTLNVMYEFSLELVGYVLPPYHGYFAYRVVPKNALNCPATRDDNAPVHEPS